MMMASIDIKEADVSIGDTIATMAENNFSAEEAGVKAIDFGDASDAAESADKKKCRNAFHFDGNRESQGYALGTYARGGIIMSNIFLSTAFIRLASESAGCVDDDGVTKECAAKVYGFRPSSLITMIAVVSGILSAFLLPFIGAVVDYTPYRRAVGIFSAAFITVVQAIQIWLDAATWFPMAVLQAINAFMYMVQVLAVYAYLPDIGREVGPTRISWFSALFTMCQFGAQALYLVGIIALSMALGLGDVATAQISQGVCVVWLIVTFIPAWWKKFPSVPALHPRPAEKSLVRVGFSQVWHTCVGINRHYGSGLRWYFLAVVWAESGANAFTVVAVTYMVEVMRMTGTQVGVIFLVTLLSTLPGAKLGEWIGKKTNPITSWKINLLVFSLVTIVGSFLLVGEERQPLMYVFGVAWGVLLGWFYPLENAIFALSVPKGQETELSGFYTYCRSILAWLPPFVFTIMNESGIHMKFGLLSMNIFLLTGAFFLFLMAPWEDVLEAAKVNKMAKVAIVQPQKCHTRMSPSNLIS